MEGNHQTIELDCPPGGIRPWDLIVGVCEGTPLAEKVTNEPVFCFFGHSEWAFEMDQERWEKEIQPVIRPRIERLYKSGVIRYGSW